ncbi:CACNA1B [Symbiodinium sp. CCMP2592]|nr:CACNA1B [Symbiodinium sp. CCMP2592]
MAVELNMPRCIYAEQLEEWLLLEAFSRLWQEQGKGHLPITHSLAVRNDLLHSASHLLDAESSRELHRYAEQLQDLLPATAARMFPRPLTSPSSCSNAEILANQFLQQGSGSLWTAVRQIAQNLPFQASSRLLGDKHLHFTVGAYGHRQYVGLLKLTRSHQAVCKMMNALIALINPGQIWTTVVINVNFDAQVHADVNNASFESLLVGLSQLWVQDDTGRTYQEHKGCLLRGRLHHVSGAAILLKAGTVLHSVQAWTGGDRITMVAYAIGQHAHIKPEDRDFLTQLGFGLPGAPSPFYPLPELPA